MAPKKRACTTRASSSQPPREDNSDAPHDPSRFLTRKAELRFERFKNIIPVVDKGMDFTGLEDMTELEPVREKIAERGWLHFIEQPGDGNLSMVREFMANCSRNAGDRVFCRGVEVDFSVDTINRIYNTPDLRQDRSNDKLLMRPETMSPFVCLPSFHYNPLGEVKQITSPVLTFESKVWFYLIISRLMPTKNGRELTFERLWLLYSLATGRDINVGDVIHKQIKYASEVTKYTPIYFPNLISFLCTRAGVREIPGDVPCPTSRPMGKVYYRKMLREMPMDGVVLEEIRPQDRQRTRTQREMARQNIRNHVELGRYLVQTRNEMVAGFNHLALQFGKEAPTFPNHVPLRDMNQFEEMQDDEEEENENGESEDDGANDDENMDADD